MEDLNRLKLVLVEKKDKQMAGWRVGSEYNYCFKVVYKYIST